MIGSSLAHYRITEKLGEGGMGAVYRARDTKLGRDVAIKVLPPALANDADYIARFQREAQVLASLNHPNIAAIYGLEDNAIVMELVEGAELRGPLPVEEAVRIAKQIADALEAAHERGIIHRDLKPANIKITADGTVKVLDFGLAKAMEPAASAASAVNSPTLTIHATTAGVILGTAAYMSPEQARGQAVDRRADIWAFGVVLWEMLTGRQMFEGETISDVLAAVLRTEPDLRSVPEQIRPVIAACLEKNPRDRLRAVGDWRRLLAESRPTAAPPRSRAPWLIASGLVLAAFGAGAFVAQKADRRELRPMTVLRAEFGDRNTVLGPRIPGSLFAISPDATKLAFITSDPAASSGLALAIRDLSTYRVRMVPNTDGAHSPFFSPNGEWVAFWSDSKLKKVRTDGGAPVAICDMPGLRGGAWTVDDQIVAAYQVGALMRVSAHGGIPQPFTTLAEGERRHRFPQILPGSDAVLFTTLNADGNGLLYAASLKTGQRKLLQPEAIFGRQLPTGHVVFVREATLYAARFDESTLTLKGSPVPVLEDIHSSAPAGASVSISQAGTLVHARSGIQNARLFRTPRGKMGEPYPFRMGMFPQVSHDGKRVSFSRDRALWVGDLERGTEQRLTPADEMWSSWTPDDSRIAFTHQGSVWWVRSDGGSAPERLTSDRDAAVPGSFSPDGKILLLGVRQPPSTGFNLFTARLTSSPGGAALGARQLLFDSGHRAFLGVFSPDGRWVAYHSEEDGSSKVYVRPYPGAGARVQVSRGWGEQPHWSRRKNELLYQAGDRRIWVVPYEIKGGAFVPGEPTRWSDHMAFGMSGYSTFDVTPDGEHVILLANLEGAAHGGETHLHFVLNFFDEVRRKVP